jgi:tetratricopeptide (TPR) repeat protein
MRTAACPGIIEAGEWHAGAPPGVTGTTPNPHSWPMKGPTMRFSPLPLSLALALIATPVFADYGSPPPRTEPPPGAAPGAAQADQAEQTPRQQAERQFSSAYDDVVKAGRDLENGRQENAQKRFRRALDRLQQAVELDSTYHEAWNLIGFTSRKLGDYPRSFAAYRTALRLKPDFALAHEYYGEGLLETGDLAGARRELAALRRCGTPELIAELEGAVAKFEAAHPNPPAVAGPAHADSAAAGGAARPDSARAGERR